MVGYYASPGIIGHMRVSNPSNLTTHFGPNSFIGGFKRGHALQVEKHRLEEVDVVLGEVLVTDVGRRNR
eukprot:COSAG02_NODE_4_length_69935_cov_46.806590_15_plen_69_part_00